MGNTHRPELVEEVSSGELRRTEAAIFSGINGLGGAWGNFSDDGGRGNPTIGEGL